ncbi:MAG TPA: carboxyl transferase domain-containing protein, partial [Phycisphaerales bacterium]|nr:carboxyl transferase domain-containing protein [Phycisphaerales bacterium]
MATPPTITQQAELSLKELTDLYRIDEQLIRAGGGKGAAARQHEKGRLTARERIELLVDGGPDDQTKLGGVLPSGGPARFMELGMWAAWGMYGDHGGAPAAGVVTGVGRVSGADCMIIANDATVKAGAFFPMTCKKIIRAQTIAMAARLPLIYLVDSAGVFLPMQEDVFPDTDDFGRIFRNNAVISAEGIPQIAAIMGFCVAGGGYLPVLCDTLLMTEGSGLYLAGPALVKAAIGQTVTDEDLGGARMHAAISGTIDFREKDDRACIARLRSLMGKYGRGIPSITNTGWTFHVRTNGMTEEEQDVATIHSSRQAMVTAAHSAAARPPTDVFSVFTDKPGTQYEVRDLLACFVDAKADNPQTPDFDEYKAEYGQ